MAVNVDENLTEKNNGPSAHTQISKKIMLTPGANETMGRGLNDRKGSWEDKKSESIDQNLDIESANICNKQIQ